MSTRAANLAAERIAQIGAICRVLMLRVMDDLNDNPSTGTGCEEVIQSINDLLVDDKLCTRAELQRFVAVERARTDQELEARKDEPA